MVPLLGGVDDVESSIAALELLSHEGKEERVFLVAVVEDRAGVTLGAPGGAAQVD